MLKIHILTKNNEQTIAQCLHSLESVRAMITVVDMGSTDETLKICRKFPIQITETSDSDCSKIRNSMLASGWNLFVHPHEFLVRGHDEINDLCKNEKIQKSFYFQVVQGHVITKEIRLWNKPIYFVNPVCEAIYDGLGISTNCVVSANNITVDWEGRLETIQQWRQHNPAVFEPYYYESLTQLMLGNFLEFTRLADHYLFHRPKGQSSAMLRYYLATVQLYEFNQINDSTRNTLCCLGMNPLMAEFWCLLGDNAYKMRDFKKAIAFYENGKILGSQRLITDKWPLDTVKYKEYPDRMIESCNTILNETKVYGLRVDNK